MRVKKLIKELKKILNKSGNVEAIIVFDSDKAFLYNVSDVYTHESVEACVISAGRD